MFFVQNVQHILVLEAEKVNLLTVMPIFECRPANVMSKFKLI